MTDVAPDTDSNAKAYSVSELAFALKRTLEDAYGFVRLRGELSKVTHHSNGHVYLTIKDERAAIDGRGDDVAVDAKAEPHTSGREGDDQQAAEQG